MPSHNIAASILEILGHLDDGPEILVDVWDHVFADIADNDPLLSRAVLRKAAEGGYEDFILSVLRTHPNPDVLEYALEVLHPERVVAVLGNHALTADAYDRLAEMYDAGWGKTLSPTDQREVTKAFLGGQMYQDGVMLPTHLDPAKTTQAITTTHHHGYFLAAVRSNPDLATPVAAYAAERLLRDAAASDRDYAGARLTQAVGELWEWLTPEVRDRVIEAHIDGQLLFHGTESGPRQTQYIAAALAGRDADKETFQKAVEASLDAWEDNPHQYRPIWQFLLTPPPGLGPKGAARELFEVMGRWKFSEHNMKIVEILAGEADPDELVEDVEPATLRPPYENPVPVLLVRYGVRSRDQLLAQGVSPEQLIDPEDPASVMASIIRRTLHKTDQRDMAVSRDVRQMLRDGQVAEVVAGLDSGDVLAWLAAAGEAWEPEVAAVRDWMVEQLGGDRRAWERLLVYSRRIEGTISFGDLLFLAGKGLVGEDSE